MMQSKSRSNALSSAGQKVAKVLRLQLKRRWRRIRFTVAGRFVRLHPNPIFILGNQKSGTSAIAALLSEATDTPATMDFRREIRKSHYAAVREGKLSFSRFVQLNKYEFSHAIVKEPNLTFFYDELMAYFPNARMVQVMRDPRDNIRSMLAKEHIPGNLTDMTAEMWQNLPPGWNLTLDSRWLGVEPGSYIEMLSHRWNLAADVYLKNTEKVTLVSYEEFVQDKAGNISRLAQKLGLTIVNSIEHRVDVQFQTSNARNVSWNDFFGGENLSKIENICGERMRLLGYAPSIVPANAR